MSKIEGISHLTFIVKDMEKSSNMLQELFEAKEIYDSSAKNFSLSREKFFLINNLWIALMEGESLSEKTYNHVAFKISESDINLYKEKIEKLGLEIKKSRSRIEEESLSIYFYDYDNHLFELHTGTLEERLLAYLNHK